MPGMPGAQLDRLLSTDALQTGEPLPTRKKASPSRRREQETLQVPAMLADLSLLCETVESEGWEPADVWGHDDRLDS